MYCSMWGLYALTGVFCILNKTFQDDLIGRGYSHDEWFNLADSSLIAYFLIIICCYISFVPLKQYNSTMIVSSLDNSNTVNKILIRIISIIFFILFLGYIFTSFNIVISSFKISDYGSLRDSLYGNMNHESTVVVSNSFIGNLCFKTCWALRYIVVYASFF